MEVSIYVHKAFDTPSIKKWSLIPSDLLLKNKMWQRWPGTTSEAGLEKVIGLPPGSLPWDMYLGHPEQLYNKSSEAEAAMLERSRGETTKRKREGPRSPSYFCLQVFGFSQTPAGINIRPVNGQPVAQIPSHPDGADTSQSRWALPKHQLCEKIKYWYCFKLPIWRVVCYIAADKWNTDLTSTRRENLLHVG